jgi:hypothetical protein
VFRGKLLGKTAQVLRSNFRLVFEDVIAKQVSSAFE